MGHVQGHLAVNLPSGVNCCPTARSPNVELPDILHIEAVAGSPAYPLVCADSDGNCGKIGLELFGRTRQSCREPKKRSHVTIVSAILCKDAIIMASDSRTTNEDGTVRDDTRKISVVKLMDGSRALVGQSGHADLASRAVEILTGLATQTPMTDYRTVADLSQDAVAQLKAELRRQFHGSAEELQRHFENHNFDLVIAHYAEVVPHIFTLCFSIGSATLRRTSFVSIGCGSPIADFLLDGFDVSRMEFSAVMATALYVIEEVKTFDPRCGGATILASTHCHWREDDEKLVSSASIIGGAILESLLAVIKTARIEARKHQQAMMHQAMRRVLELMHPDWTGNSRKPAPPPSSKD